jgi:hypothetical protein
MSLVIDYAAQCHLALGQWLNQLVRKKLDTKLGIIAARPRGPHTGRPASSACSCRPVPLLAHVELVCRDAEAFASVSRLGLGEKPRSRSEMDADEKS